MFSGIVSWWRQPYLPVGVSWLTGNRLVRKSCLHFILTMGHRFLSAFSQKHSYILWSSERSLNAWSEYAWLWQIATIHKLQLNIETVTQGTVTFVFVLLKNKNQQVHACVCRHQDRNRKAQPRPLGQTSLLKVYAFIFNMCSLVKKLNRTIFTLYYCIKSITLVLAIIYKPSHEHHWDCVKTWTN